jgi:hypothetical protein
VLPSFVANFNYDYYLDRTPEIDGGRDDTYRVEVAAVYPLFNGTDRYQDLKLQQSELEGLKGERELARQRVEQRTMRRIRISPPTRMRSVRYTRFWAISWYSSGQFHGSSLNTVRKREKRSEVESARRLALSRHP